MHERFQRDQLVTLRVYESEGEPLGRVVSVTRMAGEPRSRGSRTSAASTESRWSRRRSYATSTNRR